MKESGCAISNGTQQALADFNDAIKLDDKNSTSFCFRGLINKRLGNSAAGAADTAKAIELEPSFEEGCQKLQS